LVVEFVYRARELSPGTSFYWFRICDFRSPSTTTSACGEQLDEWLKSDHSPDSLLVVDPGAAFESLTKVIPDYGRLIDKLRNFEGTIILLARSAQNGSQLAALQDVFELGDLELQASINLLRNRLGPHAQSTSNESLLHEVVTMMACLPRAITQVADLINNTGMTVSQFLDLYQKGDEAKLRLLGRLDPVSRPDHSLSVIGKGVFDVKSFRKAHLDLSRLLYQLYFLGGISVPLTIFSMDPLDMIITTNLLKGHFIVVEDASNQTYTIHPLVYLSIRKILEGERPQADENDVVEERKWFEDIILAFSKQYPDAKCDTRAWWKDCFAQLIVGSDLSNDNLRNSVAKIYHRESAFFKRKGMYAEALKMILLAKTVLSDPTSQERMGIVQDQVSLLDILAKYRQAFEVLQSYPVEEGQTGALWKKKAQAKLELADCANRYDSALETFRLILTTREAANSSKAEQLSAIDDLGVALVHKGRYNEAAIECRRALVERTTNLGVSSPDTFTSYHNLAEILRRDGRFEDAFRNIQEAIRGRESIFGPNSSLVHHSRLVKAEILIARAISLADLDEAETLLVNSMNRLSSTLSNTHPLVITCQSDRAQIMLARGKYDAAEQINTAVLSEREQGPWLESVTHPDTLQSKHQLAEVLRLKEGCRAADTLSDKCFVERTGVLTNGTFVGEDFHPDQLTSLHHRAIVLSGLGQHHVALQKIDIALMGRRAILGADHPDVFLSMTWKGEIMRSQLQRYQSERAQTLDTIENLHKHALEGLTFIFGPEHQNTLQCSTNLALVKQERGGSSRAEAEGLYKQIYNAYAKNLGDLHPETLKSKSRLAEAMRALNASCHQEAKKMWRESCAGFAKIYGVDAYVTVTAYKGYENFLKVYPET
jgi:tetratricopeptide (TPR) repeat protein